MATKTVSVQVSSQSPFLDSANSLFSVPPKLVCVGTLLPASGCSFFLSIYPSSNSPLAYIYIYVFSIHWLLNRWCLLPKCWKFLKTCYILKKKNFLLYLWAPLFLSCSWVLHIVPKNFSKEKCFQFYSFVVVSMSSGSALSYRTCCGNGHVLFWVAQSCNHEHMWLLSIEMWLVELNFKFYLLLSNVNQNLNSHMLIVSTVLISAVLNCIPL